MRDRSLVAFTLLTQWGVGLFWALLAVRLWSAGTAGWPALESATAGAQAAVPVLAALGIAASLLHLGRPFRFWRAPTNLGRSWLSREVLLAALFLGACASCAALALWAPGEVFLKGVADGAGALLGAALLRAMSRAYRLRTVPAWDAWTTPAAFLGTALLLGSVGAAAALSAGPQGVAVPENAPGYLALAALAVLLAEQMVLLAWTRRLAGGPEASREALRRIVVGRRSWLLARLAAGGLSAVACAAAVLLIRPEEVLRLALVLALTAELFGRLLFYEARVREGL